MKSDRTAVSPAPPTGFPAVSTRFRAMQHRNFQLFIAGQLTSLIGTWMQTTAQLWLVYKLTGSAALLGVFGFASQVPMLFLSSIGGYVGDRYDRQRGVIVTQTVSMILAFALAGLTLTHLINEWELIVIAFLVGIVNAFDVPIRQAFLVQMVGKEDLPNAIALNSSIFNGARVVGPAIAGFAIALVGEGWCFFLNGLSFVAVIAVAECVEPVRIAVLGLYADLRAGHFEGKRPDARTTDEFRGNRSSAGGAAFRSAHALQGTGAVGRNDVNNLRGVSDPFFAGEDVLAVHGRFIRRWICGHFANGSDEHAHSKSRARRTAQPGDGGLRHDVYGSAADWRTNRRRSGEADWRALYTDGVRIAGVGGEPDFHLSSGDEARRNANSDGGLGWIRTIEPGGLDEKLSRGHGI